MKKKIVILMLIVIVISIITGCTSKTKKSASESNSEKQDKGYGLIGGEWIVAGVYKDNQLIDLSDPKYATLDDLYDGYMLTINEDGSFVLKENIFFIKGNYDIDDTNDDKKSFLCSASESYQTLMEKGEIVKKNERNSDKVYVVRVLDDTDSLEFCEYDVSLKTEKADATKFLLKRLDSKEEDNTSSTGVDATGDFVTHTIQDIMFDIPKEWTETNSNTEDESTSSSIYKSPDNNIMVGVVVYHLSSMNIDTNAKAEALLDYTLRAMSDKNKNKDLTIDQYEWSKNPALHAHYRTANNGVDTDVYSFMVSDEEILAIMCGYAKNADTLGHQTVDHIIQSLNMPEFYPGSSSGSQNSGANDKSKSNKSFTNKYGTPTTKCNHPGCDNYIAPSGDTNCCTIHSDRCLKCNKYIDEDATYCMDCLSGAVDKNNSTGSSKSSFTNKYGTPTTKCNHPGCNNYIASSGDTNCCTTHSNRCINCNKYIDEDAMYCPDCLTNTVDKSNSKESYGISSDVGGPGKCKYKENGQYVCSKKAVYGDLCKEHYEYLNDVYNSLVGK